MTAADIGVITNAIPRPPSMKPGSICQNPELTVTVESSRQQSATVVIPPAISQREPTRAESLPAIGAKMTIRIDHGSRAAPAWIGDQPREDGMEIGKKTKIRNIASVTRM